MKYQKIIVAIVFLSAVFSVYPFKIIAAESEPKTAKCRILSFDEAFNSAKSVFVGKILSEEKNGDLRTFKFEVNKYWKGANKKTIEISVYETMRYQAWFKVGEVYLIYASANDNDKLSVGRCSRSRLQDEAAEDLRKLGTGKKPD